jgi:polyisoprenoid-binding protein YceI
MKQFFILLTLAAFFTACGGPEGQSVESAEAQAETAGDAEMVASVQYNIDATASVVNWEGFKFIGGGHTGTIPVANGQIMTAEGKIVGGKFVMDVNGITNTDMPADDGGDKLVGHLKSGDFFDVEKHPMANFTITQVQAITDAEDGHTHEITGNLVLKGTSRSITIPATISMDGSMLKATTPKFTIDRKEWGMEYGSSGIEGLAKDKIINDEVGLEIMLVASK